MRLQIRNLFNLCFDNVTLGRSSLWYEHEARGCSEIIQTVSAMGASSCSLSTVDFVEGRKSSALNNCGKVY